MSATTDEIIRSLYRKLRQGHSWEDWDTYMKGNCSKRRAQNLLKEMWELSSVARPCDTESHHAAFFDFQELYALYLDHISVLEQQTTHKRVIKIWWDERRIQGALQTVVGISPISPKVARHHSWTHFFPFMLIDPRSTLEISELLKRSDLSVVQIASDLPPRNETPMNPSEAPNDAPHEESHARFCIVLDWQCYYKLSDDCHSPNSITLHQRLCPCCLFDVNDKLGFWRTDPWLIYKRDPSRI